MRRKTLNSITLFIKKVAKHTSKITENTLQRFLAALPVPLKRANGLIILDNFFPGWLSTFRFAEFNYYLEHIECSKVYTLRSASQKGMDGLNLHSATIAYLKVFPANSMKIERFKALKNPNCKLIYLVFLNITFNLIDYIENWKTPFVFTLYPGGGFALDDPKSDRKLERVLGSKFLRKVIVTQRITKDYLLKKEFCPPDRIEYIYGGVFPPQAVTTVKQKYPVDKNSFDICFVANKYMQGGLDKGYDVFLVVAKKLASKLNDVKFHVVGNFNETDGPINGLEDHICFYGVRNAAFFANFYTSMDIILSPNVANVLCPGGFDGFPTGCCIDAGMSGVAVLCTDPLSLNEVFVDRKEIHIVSGNSDEMARDIAMYYKHPDLLDALSQNGQAAFSRIFNLEAQMHPRLSILRECMSEADTT